jgi:hypothetical protein
MTAAATSVDRDAWRLLPGERVVFAGTPRRGVPRPVLWRVAPLLFGAMAAIMASFAGLLLVTELGGAERLALSGLLLSAIALFSYLAPGVLLDDCAFLVTDRRALWRRGAYRRSLDLDRLSFARVRWHPRAPGVGTLELVRAVPFGPLKRQQRLAFHDIDAPDRLLTTIRGREPSPGVGDADLPLIQRLDDDESVVWGGHPEGTHLGLPEVAMTLGGVGFLVFGLRYGREVGGILVGLEAAGLSVQTWTWLLFFTAIALSWVVFCGIGAGLVYAGWWRARGLGGDTEYLLTDRRLLIRRGHTELSVDRQRIVDLADTPAWGGLRHVYLVLDDPDGRALSVSGALARLPPPRESVPPVLYEVREVQSLRRALARGGASAEAHVQDAA